MAKSPMQNIWNDRKREDDRLKKVTMKKKTDSTSVAKPDSSETESASPDQKNNNN